MGRLRRISQSDVKLIVKRFTSKYYLRGGGT